jgi:hypothetical protein
MFQAFSARFVPAAIAFLLICVSVLFLAAASTFVPVAGNDSRASRVTILSALLH